ncbi:hypothetical protein TNCV_1350311 [Trichonephila clavipes]|nr:hypothetical protein TNCV_1350311 [Trichonephila clavipes]
MWACIILLKVSFRNALKEGNDFELQHFTDVLVAIEITLYLKQIGSSMQRNRIPNHNSGCWATMSFDNALLKAAFTGIASSMNAAIMVLQIEARSRRWFAVRRILYEGILARNPRCSRRLRIDKIDIVIPVTVDERAANCLEEASPGGRSPAI